VSQPQSFIAVDTLVDALLECVYTNKGVYLGHNGVLETQTGEVPDVHLAQRERLDDPVVLLIAIMILGRAQRM